MKITDQTPLTEEAESALVARLPDTAAEIVMRTLPAGIKYLSKVCRGSKSEEELTSLAYAALTKAVRNLRPGKGRFFIYSKMYLRSAVFSSWKDLRTVRNVEKIEMIDFESYQKLKQCQSQKGNNGFEIYEEIETAGHPSEEFDFQTMHIKELFSTTEKAIKKVCSDHEKTVLQLKFQLGYSYPKISVFLGVTLSAVQSSCERALRKLRIEMTKENLHSEGI